MPGSSQVWGVWEHHPGAVFIDGMGGKNEGGSSCSHLGGIPSSQTHPLETTGPIKKKCLDNLQ